DFNKQEVTSFLSSKLPDHMVPQMLVQLSRIPLTSNGKVDKKSLPDPDASDLIGTIYVAPTNKLEQTVVDIWKDLLHINKLGTNDNFFELGGNSLLAQHTISLLLKKDIVFPITKLYQFPTAAG